MGPCRNVSDHKFECEVDGGGGVGGEDGGDHQQIKGHTPL